MKVATVPLNDCSDGAKLGAVAVNGASAIAALGVTVAVVDGSMRVVTVTWIVKLPSSW